MGEYIKLGGSDAAVKLGTCEDLEYITYDEMQWAVAHGAKRYSSSNLEPSGYLDPACGWHYRWPFTSEHTGGLRTPLTAERIASRGCSRSLTVDVTGLPIVLAHRSSVVFERKGEDGFPYRVELPCPQDEERFGASGAKRIEYGVQGVRLQIVGEKLMPDGTLQTLIRCPVCGALCRLDEREAELLRVQCKLIAAKMQQCEDLSVEDVEYVNDLLIAAQRIKGQPIETEG
jgi:hypothetical protein